MIALVSTRTEVICERCEHQTIVEVALKIEDRHYCPTCSNFAAEHEKQRRGFLRREARRRGGFPRSVSVKGKKLTMLMPNGELEYFIVSGAHRLRSIIRAITGED